MEWYVYILISAVFVAIAQLLNKKVLQHEHALEFSANKNLLLIPFLLCIIPFVNFSLPWYVYISIYGISVLISMAGLHILKSIRHGDISTVTPMTNISPLFLLIIAFLILGETPTGRQIVGVLFLIVGAYSLQVGINNKGFLEPVRAFFKSKVMHHLVIAMGIASLTATLDKIILNQYADPWTYFFILASFRAINLIALELYRHGHKELLRDIKKDFKATFAGAGAVFFASIAYLYGLSMPGVMVSLVIPIKRMSTLITTFFGGSFFHEKNIFVKILSCIIMIWGAVFILL